MRMPKEGGRWPEALTKEARLDRTYLSGVEQVVRNPTDGRGAGGDRVGMQAG